MALPMVRVCKWGAPQRSPSRHARPARKTGLTLVEMMVAVAVTLILMFAVLKMASVISDSSETGRALLEISGELRSAALHLQDDLDRLTTPAIAPLDPNSGGGYLEILEGPMRDASSGTPHPLQGDVDDVLMFTAFSGEIPFTGRLNGSLIQSNLAEIVYWTRFDVPATGKSPDDDNASGAWDIGERRTLYRRVLLIRPDLTLGGGSVADFQRVNDISCRIGPGGTLVANSLADLTQRANRFCHNQATFPHLIDLNRLANSAHLGSDAIGEDIVLSRVMAFDLRVWDPRAPLMAGNPTALGPGDPGYAPPGNAAVGYGAFVDINYAGQAMSITAGRTSPFSGQPEQKSGLAGFGSGTYDTWSWAYESDGLPQYGPTTDGGTNGIDDDNNGLVDDPGERDTSPPYPVPLRGVQVTLRVYESDTRQVRQASVVGDFTPQ